MRIKGVIRSIIEVARTCDTPLTVSVGGWRASSRAYEVLCELGADTRATVYRDDAREPFVIEAAVYHAGQCRIVAQAPARPATADEVAHLEANGHEHGSPIFCAGLRR